MGVIPTIEMVGPAGRRIVNACDEQGWRKKGYRLASEKPQAEGDGLDAMKVADLKELVESEDIDLGEATKKNDIIAAIREARAEKQGEE